MYCTEQHFHKNGGNIILELGNPAQNYVSTILLGHPAQIMLLPFL